MFVVALLVMSAFLATTSVGKSQSFTTVTNFQTNKTTATYTQHSLYPTETTIYVTTLTSAVYSLSFVAKNPGGRDCETYRFPFNATAGQTIQGTVTASQPIDFYIMTQSEENLLWSGGYCNPNAGEVGNGGGALVSQTKITSYEVN